MQCIVQKDGASFESNTGTVYRAWYGDESHSYDAICAGRGDSNIQEDFLKGCVSYATLCDQAYSEDQVLSKMRCVVEWLKQFKEHICNGGHYTLFATSASWSYRGYTGSIAGVDAGQGGACFAICN